MRSIRSLSKYVQGGKEGSTLDYDRKPMAIVYVKSGSNRLMKDFFFCCVKNDLRVNPVQDDCPIGMDDTCHGADTDERLITCGVLELIGSEANISRMIDHPAVIQWHFALSCHIGQTGTGQGPEKVKASASKASKASKEHKHEYKFGPPDVSPMEDQLGAWPEKAIPDYLPPSCDHYIPECGQDELN